jgi:hypothetical protein
MTTITMTTLNRWTYASPSAMPRGTQAALTSRV